MFSVTKEIGLERESSECGQKTLFKLIREKKILKNTLGNSLMGAEGLI